MDRLYELLKKIITKLSGKVDSEEGKGLSTNDFTTEEQTKLSEIEEEAQVNTIETISVNGTKVEPDEAKNVEIKAYNEDNKPEVGGRNLVLDSGVPVSTSSYLMKTYLLAENLKQGETVTITIKGTLGAEKTGFGIYNTAGTVRMGEILQPDENGLCIATANVVDDSFSDAIRLYALPDTISSVSSIEWIKLERGEIATDWTPAPEDLMSNAENFEGVLPIEKGGTGTSDGNITKEEIGTFYMGHNASNGTLRACSGVYSSDSNVRAYLGIGPVPWGLDNSMPNIIVKSDASGNASGYYKNAEIVNMRTYATTSNVGVVKPGSGLSVLSDGTLNVDLDEQKILAQIANRTYQGTDLTVKFKSEIDGSFSGNPWAWIQDRINNANWEGLHVCDYIPFTTTNNNVTMQAQIAGIDTYYQYGDRPVPHHIDFITRELWPTLRQFNPVNYNNGTAAQNYPWLASDMYLWLNSLSGPVPNAAKVNPETTEVDYTTDGVYYFLPKELKAVIIEKRFLLETRYNASSLLTTSPGWGWQNAGKLWLPTEMEVYGTNVWGGAGYPTGGGIQYPIFANSMNRLKYLSGSRYNWWLSTPNSGNSTYWGHVSSSGLANNATATNTWIGAPVCFRIASTVKTADMPEHEPEIIGDESPENEPTDDPLTE